MTQRSHVHGLDPSDLERGDLAQPRALHAPDRRALAHTHPDRAGRTDSLTSRAVLSFQEPAPQGRAAPHAQFPSPEPESRRPSPREHRADASANGAAKRIRHFLAAAITGSVG
jgi:hypothetical protein